MKIEKNVTREKNCVEKMRHEKQLGVMEFYLFVGIEMVEIKFVFKDLLF